MGYCIWAHLNPPLCLRACVGVCNVYSTLKYFFFIFFNRQFYKYLECMNRSLRSCPNQLETAILTLRQTHSSLVVDCKVQMPSLDDLREGDIATVTAADNRNDDGKREDIDEQFDSFKGGTAKPGQYSLANIKRHLDIWSWHSRKKIYHNVVNIVSVSQDWTRTIGHFIHNEAVQCTTK